ncbi:hypothetical protein MnTg02_02532 [bacterium MnTg02]|nr:hypothetical protein MnTg02_02532 [bacterium MnTg02]
MIRLPTLAPHTFSSHANAVQRDHADTNGCAISRVATDRLRPGAAQNKQVRERRSGRDRTIIALTADTIPAHHSKSLPAQLNSRWRVADDPRQWILQKRKGQHRSKSSGWLSRSFCATRSALLRCIREYCGNVDAESLNPIENLPETHLEWRRSKGN